MKYDNIIRYICGDIVCSRNVGSAMKRWRNFFNIQLNVLASKLNISSSALIGYEKNKRKSPGAQFIYKYVTALIELDLELNDGINLNKLNNLLGFAQIESKYIKIVEFTTPICFKDIEENLKLKEIRKTDVEEIYGYTYIDAEKAFLNIDPPFYVKFFGRNPQRIFIFDNVENGKTVMATVRIGKFLSYMVPPIIILLNTKKSNVHRFAKVVAELEGIGLYCTELDKKEFLKLIDEIIL